VDEIEENRTRLITLLEQKKKTDQEEEEEVSLFTSQNQGDEVEESIIESASGEIFISPETTPQKTLGESTKNLSTASKKDIASRMVGNFLSHLDIRGRERDIPRSTSQSTVGKTDEEEKTNVRTMSFLEKPVMRNAASIRSYLKTSSLLDINNETPGSLETGGSKMKEGERRKEKGPRNAPTRTAQVKKGAVKGVLIVYFIYIYIYFIWFFI
jgi:hypothetical protein